MEDLRIFLQDLIFFWVGLALKLNFFNEDVFRNAFKEQVEVYHQD